MGEGTPLDRRGLTWGLIAVAIVVALTFIGSDQLVWFDAALVGYLFGTIFAVFGVVVPLRRVAAAAAHRDVEPPRVGCVPGPQGAQRGGAARARRHPAAGPDVHPPPVADAVAGPPAGLLGVHPRRAHHVPAHAGPAALRERRPAGRPLPGVRVAGRHVDVRCRQRRRLDHLPRPRHRRGPGAGRRVHLPAPPAPATRARWPSSAAATSWPSPGCSPCR